VLRLRCPISIGIHHDHPRGVGTLDLESPSDGPQSAFFQRDLLKGLRDTAIERPEPELVGPAPPGRQLDPDLTIIYPVGKPAFSDAMQGIQAS
jgi:hypothetical protein